MSDEKALPVIRFVLSWRVLSCEVGEAQLGGRDPPIELFITSINCSGSWLQDLGRDPAQP